MFTAQYFTIRKNAEAFHRKPGWFYVIIIIYPAGILPNNDLTLWNNVFTFSPTKTERKYP